MATSVRRDLDVTKYTVENAESRARLHIKKRISKPLRGNNRQYAQALHRQADKLCQRLNDYLLTEISSCLKSHSGEYESALVLYHRAATVCPHDSSHNVAAQRTSATISSWNNPRRSYTKFKADTRNDTISRVISYAAFGTLDVSKSPDLAVIPDRYLGTRQITSCDTISTPEPLNCHLIRSRTMLEHVNSRADATLKNLKASFHASDMRASLRLAQDLLVLAPDLEDPRRHRIPAYHYLSLIHAALGRHDRACSSVATLIRLSRSTNDVVSLSRALMTMGKVHLTFGHLQAAARAWENMAVYVDHPVSRAWLHHEIGRCHLERGMYVKALQKATQCRECAGLANSKKWSFHAGLLMAQCLAMLGRFAEALEELRVIARINKEEGDILTLSYIRDLIEQLNRALREVTFGEDQRLKSALRRLSSREELERPDEVITTSGIKRTMRSSDSVLAPSLQPADRYETGINFGRSILARILVTPENAEEYFVHDGISDWNDHSELN